MARVLICHVPKEGDTLAEQGARAFGEVVARVNCGDSSSGPQVTVLLLERAIAASKLAAEFLRDTTTVVVIGHGAEVYQAIGKGEFVWFLNRFERLCSLIFVSCELDKGHPEKPGFEANAVDLLAKQYEETSLKIYAAKTDVMFSTIHPNSFVWFHSPGSHLVPSLSSGILRKDKQSPQVQNTMKLAF